MTEVLTQLSEEVARLRERMDNREPSVQESAGSGTFQGSEEAPVLPKENEGLELHASDSFSGEESDIPGSPEHSLTQVYEGTPQVPTPTPPGGVVTPAKEEKILTEANIAMILTELNSNFELVQTPPTGPATEGWRCIGNSPEGRAVAAPQTKPFLHVDGVFPSIFQKVASGFWAAYPLELDRALRVPDCQYDALVRSPPLSTGAWERLVLHNKARVSTSAEGLRSYFTLGDAELARETDHLSGFDRAARLALK